MKESNLDKIKNLTKYERNESYNSFCFRIFFISKFDILVFVFYLCSDINQSHIVKTI